MIAIFQYKQTVHVMNSYDESIIIRPISDMHIMH